MPQKSRVNSTAEFINLSDEDEYQLVPDTDPDEDEPTTDDRGSHRGSTCHSPPRPSSASGHSARLSRGRSLGILRSGTGLLPQRTWADVLGELLESVAFQAPMALVILLNSVVVGLETDLKNFFSWDQLENIFLLIFFVELLLKLAAFGPSRIYDYHGKEFSWNLFDTVIVLVGVTDVLSGLIIGSRGGGKIATVFRIIRILRILRIIRIVRFWKQLYLLAIGFAEAAKAVVWVTVLMAFIVYVCSIVLVRTLGHGDKDNEYAEFLNEKFKTMGLAMFTLFELMASPSLQEYHLQTGLLASHPLLTAFLIMWVIFGSFGMVALLTGVISESLFAKGQVRLEEAREERESQHVFIEDWCRKEFDEIDVNEEEEATIEQIAAIMPRVIALCKEQGIDFRESELARLAEFMDTDNSGFVSLHEFHRAILAVVDGHRPVSVQELKHAILVTQAKIDTNASALKRIEESMEAQVRPDTAGEAGQSQRLCRRSAKKLTKLVDLKGRGTTLRSSRGSTSAGAPAQLKRRERKALTATALTKRKLASIQSMSAVGSLGSNHGDEQLGRPFSSEQPQLYRQKANVDLLATPASTPWTSQQQSPWVSQNLGSPTSPWTTPRSPHLAVPANKESSEILRQIKERGDQIVDRQVAHTASIQEVLQTLRVLVTGLQARTPLQKCVVEPQSPQAHATSQNVGHGKDEPFSSLDQEINRALIVLEGVGNQRQAKPQFRESGSCLNELALTCPWEEASSLLLRDRALIRGLIIKMRSHLEGSHPLLDVTAKRSGDSRSTATPSLQEGAKEPTKGHASLSNGAASSAPASRESQASQAVPLQAVPTATMEGASGSAGPNDLQACEYPLVDLHYDADAWAAVSPGKANWQCDFLNTN